MKRFFFVLLMTILVIPAFSGEITHVYYFDQPEISQKGQFDIVNFKGCMLTNHLGAPLLPYHAVSLLLPPGEKAVSIELIKENLIQIDGDFQLFPAQASRPISETKPFKFEKNKSIYASSQAYPSDLSGEFTTSYMNGFAVAMSSFTPVQYIPSTGKLSYYQKITIKIKTESDFKSAEALKMLKRGSNVNYSLQRLVQNPEILTQYKSAQSKNTGDYELLIITPQAFESNFSTLVDMYKLRGIRALVKTTEYIAANSTGIDPQDKIRNFIIQEYQSKSIDFVLLGGDVEHIPYRGFYCYVQSGSGYTDDDIPADLYYSALDGNWNNDGDNKWGEIGEEDLVPEVAVGRFSFSNATELDNMIHKTMAYQNQPVLGQLTSPLFAGENLYSGPDTWGSDYLELLIGERTDNGYTTIGIPATYNIQKMYDEVSTWSGTGLINAINQGKQFVHHVGHASQTYVAKLYNSDITDANFAASNGVTSNYSILQTHGCDCGAFDYSDCILEKMVSIQNFAVAVVGNSRYGWFNEGQTEGPSAHLHREMNDALFQERISFLGTAMVEGKAMTAPWVTAPGQYEEGALRWNFYDLNLLGDPALSVWTAEPIQVTVNYQSELIIGVGAAEVTVSLNGIPLSNFTCSILKNNQIVAVSKTNQNGLAQLNFDEPILEVGAAKLQVVGYNALPQSFDIMFIPSDGAYVIYDAHTINDANGGNGNGQIDYGETINLSMQIKNVGMAPANQITATLSTTDTYASIQMATAIISEIPAGGTVNITDAFSFVVSPTVPDQHSISMLLTCSNGTQSWSSSFSLQANAPEFSIGDPIINDLLNGNGNGRLDPGETISLEVQISNLGGATAYASIASIYTSSSYVSISPAQLELNTFNSGESKTAIFSVSVSPDIAYGTVVNFDFTIEAPGYSANEIFYLPVGLRIENFESGSFDSYEWQHAGNANWTISQQLPFEGSNCAKSGVIAHSQQSDLWLSLIAMGNDEISFARKTSSESGYDYLKFYVDNAMKEQWSGEMAWQIVAVPIESGPHNLRWSYVKDNSVASGSDCAWIDKITFPGTTTVISIIENNMQLSIGPNPNDGRFLILTPSERQVHIKMFDLAGKLVLETTAGTQNTTIDASYLNAGVYIVEVQNIESTYRTKMVIKK